MVEILDTIIAIGVFIHGICVELSIAYTLYKALQEFRPDLLEKVSTTLSTWKQKIRDIFQRRG